MGLGNWLRNLASGVPTTASAVSRKQTRIARLDVQQEKLEEQLETAYEPTKIRTLQRKIRQIELEQSAGAVQLMNGLNAQLLNLQKEFALLRDETNSSVDILEETTDSMVKLSAKVNPDKVFQIKRIRRLTQLAFSPDLKKVVSRANQGKQRKVSLAAAEGIIKKDIKAMTDVLVAVEKLREDFLKAKEAVNRDLRRCDNVSESIHGIITELNDLGHDFIPKVAYTGNLIEESRNRHKKAAKPMRVFGGLN